MYSSSSVYGAMMTTYIVAGIIGLIAGVAFGYFSGKIAAKKGYSFGGFFALGFFLGVIGLVIALVISDKTLSSATTPRIEGADDLIKYKSLLDQGAISQEEFDAKKQAIMSGTPTPSTSSTYTSNAAVGGVFLDPSAASATIPPANTSPQPSVDPKRGKTMKTTTIALTAIAGLLVIIGYGMTISNLSSAAATGRSFTLSPQFWIALIAVIAAFACVIASLATGKKELGIAAAVLGAIRFIIAFIGIVNTMQIASQYAADVSGSIASSFLLGIIPSICLMAAGIISYLACKQGLFPSPKAAGVN